MKLINSNSVIRLMIRSELLKIKWQSLQVGIILDFNRTMIRQKGLHRLLHLGLKRYLLLPYSPKILRDAKPSIFSGSSTRTKSSLRISAKNKTSKPSSLVDGFQIPMKNKADDVRLMYDVKLEGSFLQKTGLGCYRQSVLILSNQELYIYDDRYETSSK